MYHKFRLSMTLLVCSTSLGSGIGHAQAPVSEREISDRFNAIERALANRRAEIVDLEAQLAQLRTLIKAPLLEPKTVTPPPQPALIAKSLASPAQTELLVDADSLDRALSDPNDFFNQLGASAVASQVAARQLNDAASQPIFDRPNLPAGISTALTLGNSSEASVNFSRPIIWRKVNKQTGDFAPQLGTVSIGLFTPLQAGLGTGMLFSDTDQDRFDRSNRDIPSGTRVRLGFDFLSFSTINNREVADGGARRDTARRRVVDVLYAARDVCLKHYASPSTTSRNTFYGMYETSAPLDVIRSIPAATSEMSASPTPLQLEARQKEVEGLCSGDNLARFIVSQRADSTTPSGGTLAYPEMARNFLGAFWDAGPQQMPTWGWGMSGELGTTDFTYRQAINPITLIPDTVAAAAGFPGRMSVNVDPSGGFRAPHTESHNFWTVRGYGLFTLFRKPPSPNTPKWFFPGLTLVGSAEYSGSYSFRPGTTNLSICPAQPVDPVTMQPRNVSARCGNFNVDAPLDTDSITLAAEARFRFLNVPLIRTLSFAPRYSHRLDDGAQILDLPVYLQNDANGFGNAGLRFRHRWGGRDLLGNRDFSASEVAVFFVPLRFNGL